MYINFLFLIYVNLYVGIWAPLLTITSVLPLSTPLAEEDIFCITIFCGTVAQKMKLMWEILGANCVCMIFCELYVAVGSSSHMTSLILGGTLL